MPGFVIGLAAEQPPPDGHVARPTGSPCVGSHATTCFDWRSHGRLFAFHPSAVHLSVRLSLCQRHYVALLLSACQADTETNASDDDDEDDEIKTFSSRIDEVTSVLVRALPLQNGGREGSFTWSLSLIATKHRIFGHLTCSCHETRLNYLNIN